MIATALVSATHVEAATRVWDGGGGDGLWSTPANWSADTLPVAGDTVTFNATSTANALIDVPVTVAIFQVNAGYTGTITQAAGQPLNLTTSYTQAAGTFAAGASTFTLVGAMAVNAGGTFNAGPSTINVTGATTVGGSFNGGGSTINLTGALTVSAGGVFTSTSGTLTVTGAVTFAAGVFTHNSGTVDFSTSNVTLNLGGAATFNNVRFLSGIKTFSAANTMTVLGTLTLAGGQVNTGTIAAQGNIDSQSAFAGGTTILLINGTTPQTWGGTAGGATDLLVVNINNPASTLTITASLRTTRNWTFTASGGLTASGSSIIFAGGTITGSHTLGAVEIAGTVTLAAGTTLTVPGTLTLTSGTLTAGTVAAQGNITIATAFTGGTTTLLINGTSPQTWSGSANGAADTLLVVNINNPASTLTITASLRTTRNWTFTASGGLTASGSSIIFAGGTITGSHTLGAVEIAGTVTLAAGTTLTVPGTLTLTSGTLTAGTVAAQGNITIATAFTGGTTTLLINGTSPQTWSGSANGAADTLLVVNINNPASTLTITASLRTTRNWTFTASGGLTASGSSIIFAGGTITGSHTLGAVEIAGTVTLAAGTTLTVPGTLTLTSGTLTAGTVAAQGNITIATAFTGGTTTLLINGTSPQTWSGSANGAADTLLVVNINNPASTLTITASLRTTRNWTFTASGGLTASGSSIIFAGGTITGSHTLGAVEIAGTVTLAAGTTLNVPGTLTLTSGALNQVAATGILAAQGDVFARIGFTGGGTATLLINGSGAQTFDGDHTTTAGALMNVDIDKSSGTLTITDTLRTGRNWTVTNQAGMVVTGSTLAFAGGIITGSHTLNNVDIRGTVTIAAGTTLSVAGFTELFSGALNQVAATGILAAQGDVFARIGFTGGGTATLLINGSGAQTFDGDHTTTAGALMNVDIDKSSGTLTITDTLRTGRNWTVTNQAGMVVTGSTLAFAGGIITGSHTLNNVDIRGTVTIAAGTTLSVAGFTELFSGALNQVAATGILAAQGDVFARIGYTGSGTATLLINGTGAQTFDGDHNPTTGSLPNVDINKTSGALTITDTLRTGRNWTVTNASGGLVVSGSTLVFAGGTISGSHTLNNVDIRGTVSIAAGTTLSVAGITELFSGALNQVAATGILAAQGDVFARIGYTGSGTATLLINGTGAQTFDGDHTAVAGTLPNVDINKTSGALTITDTLRTGRNWTVSNAAGGLFVGGSSLVFVGGTLTITGDQTLNNVELRSGDITVAAGDTLSVGGLLTLTDGNLVAGTVAALGNILLQAGYDGEGGTVRIAGTLDQTMTGFADALNTDMPNIVIDKPSGTLHLVGTMRMVTSSWTWLQGTIDAGTSTVHFDATVTITGSHALFDVYLSGGSHTVTSGDTLTVLGTLTLDNGTIDGGSIAAAGPIIQLSTFDGGTGVLEIVGSVGHTFAGSATTALGNLPDVRIDTTGGTLMLTGTIRTTHDWTHAVGAVDADGSTVVFAGTLLIDAGNMAFNDVLVNAGTATLTSDLDVDNDLTIAAGTLAMGSNNVFVAGDVTVDAGLTVTTGTLDMNGVSGQILGGAAAIGLFNLSINNAAGVTQTTTVSVAGTLDLSGPYAFDGESLSIAHAITGAPNYLTADAAATLIVNGTGSGIVIPASITDLLNLSVSNPNGTALAGPLSVGGTCTLAGGNVNAGAFVLSIGPGGTVSRTSGHVIGALQKWVPAGAAVIVLYEIGDATAYAPISLTFATVIVTGQLTAFTTPGEHPSVGSSPIDPTHDVNRWWTATNDSVTFDSFDATFTFVAADLDPGANTNAFIVAKWDGAWTTPASGANTATTVTAFGMTSLSEFAVGEAGADLQIAKAGPISATAGDPAGFDYTVTVHNAGGADNAGGFVVTDQLPTGLTLQLAGTDARCAAIGQNVTCTNAIGLNAGADDVFILHVTLASTINGGSVLGNSATVTSSGTNDPDGTNDTSSVVLTTVVEDVQLSAVKAFGSATITAGGASGTFTITITNGGVSDADNIVVTDAVDGRLTVDSIAPASFDCSLSSGQSLDCRLAHLAGGATRSFTVTYHVDASVGQATIANQADATSDEDGGVGVDSIDVSTGADIADLDVDSPDPVAAGSTLTYTITVTNLGPSDALSVTLTSTLDAALQGATYCLDLGSGCGSSNPWTGSVNLGTIPAGGSIDVVISATVDPSTPPGTVIANSATVTTTTPDPAGANNVSSNTTEVVAPTPSPSVPDTGAAQLPEQVAPIMLFLGFAAWIALVTTLATEGVRRRRAVRRASNRRSP